jgi:hypothetical protein
MSTVGERLQHKYNSNWTSPSNWSYHIDRCFRGVNPALLYSLLYAQHRNSSLMYDKSRQLYLSYVDGREGILNGSYSHLCIDDSPLMDDAFLPCSTRDYFHQIDIQPHPQRMLSPIQTRLRGAH